MGNLFPEKKAPLPALDISDHSLYAEFDIFLPCLFRLILHSHMILFISIVPNLVLFRCSGSSPFLHSHHYPKTELWFFHILSLIWYLLSSALDSVNLSHPYPSPVISEPRDVIWKSTVTELYFNSPPEFPIKRNKTFWKAKKLSLKVDCHRIIYFPKGKPVKSHKRIVKNYKYTANIWLKQIFKTILYIGIYNCQDEFHSICI